MDDAAHLSKVSTGSPDEDQFEKTTIERLQQLGYERRRGRTLREEGELGTEDVVYRPALRTHLKKKYPHLDETALKTAVQRAAAPDGVDLEQRNKVFHELLTEGAEVPYEPENGEEAYEHVYFVDWEDPENNTFWVVDQLAIQGRSDRRPDLIVYVNGLPLVAFELKNPYDENPSVLGAYNQLQHYLADIPSLFDFNAFCVLSDGTETLHGVHSASREWFSPWRSIDGENVERTGTGSMKTLIEGLFPKRRLLEYIRRFIVHEETGEGIVKKGAKYHQFFGVRFAVENALRATRPKGDRRIGVVWHTQGAGKSLSMVFFVGILRKALNNPTVLVQVDRKNLDEQLYESFLVARQAVGSVKHADDVGELRTLLQTEGGEVVFSTVEKFQLRGTERDHPILSERRDIIVIADEAHRTQYGFSGTLKMDEETGEQYTTFGYARYLRQALPNASFIGFTGTPIDKDDRDTVSVFGDVIHTYDLTQAQSDGVIVPISYEARLIDLQLQNEAVDEELEEIAEEHQLEKEKARWSAIEAAAGAKERMEHMAQDIVRHYEKRTETLEGKGMIACMSRRICVRLFNEITELRPDWYDPELDRGKVKVVMTGDITRDPPAWKEAGHLTTSEQRENLKERFKDPDDELRLVIVCDMWLTGTNLPCLHTLYVDKPMSGHNLMQAIARVNRVFRDKPGGLIVDYIGISTELKAATRKYTQEGFEPPAEELEGKALSEFGRALEDVRATLPVGVDLTGWKTLGRIEFEDLCARLYGHYVETDEKRDDFLLKEKRLSRAFSLISHLDEVQAEADEVAFYQLVRSQLMKTKRSQEQEASAKHRQAVRDLVDRSIGAEEAVDIFEAAGIDKPDISILSEDFLEEFKSKEQENLRLKLLEKLMQDEIKLRRRKNVARSRSFQEMLESTLERYRSGAITAAEVIQAMVELREEMRADEARMEETGLSEEELAFLDAVAELEEREVYDMPFLCDLVREVVESVKDNLEVDWTKPHRENVKTSVRAAIKRVLRRRGVGREHFQFILGRVMEQAEELYQDWPRRA